MVVNRKTVEKDLALLRRQMEEGRSGWIVEESCGRCLRALGRREEGEPHLRASLDRGEPQRPHQWLAVGAVHRLLGESAQAQQCWRRAIEGIEAGGRREIDLGRLAEALFLSGRNDEALALARDVEQDKLTRAAGVRMLAEARQRGDGDLAGKAADWFADRIRREREKVHATGMVNLHDWHEIATELKEELTRSV